MRILQGVPALSAGGVERTVIEIASALTASGHQAHVASAGGRLEAELAAAGGVLHVLPLESKNPIIWRRNTKALIALIKARKIDLVHARSRAPARSLRDAAKACGVPFVTTYHGIYNAKSALKRRYNSVMAQADCVIANSQFTADHIMKEHGTPKARITVIARGVDMARFDPKTISARDIADQRKAWGLNQGQTCFLLPGRLTRWKGQAIAIEALAQIKDQTDAALVLLGDAQGRDAYVKALQDQAAAAGLAHRVIIAGHSADVPTALAAADIVISASTDPEAFGRVAAEAQAMGRWIIASDHGGSRETVVPRLTGERTPPHNAKALAKALLAGPPITYDAQTARSHINSHFSDKLLQEKTLAVYARLLSPPAKVEHQV